MKKNWFSKGYKCYILIALIGLSAVQFFHAQGSLLSFRNRSDRDSETLQERMKEDNIPSNIKEHIIYVQNQSAFSAELLVNSLSFMQIFTQFNILLVFWIFFSTKKSKSDGE